MERAFIVVRSRIPGLTSYISWITYGIDVLEGDAWIALQQEDRGKPHRIELLGLSYDPPTD